MKVTVSLQATGIDMHTSTVDLAKELRKALLGYLERRFKEKNPEQFTSADVEITVNDRTY